MTREDFVYVNLDVKFVEIIDKLVDRILWHGEKKYRSRRDFIIKACQKLIDQEEDARKRDRLLKEVSA